MSKNIKKTICLLLSLIMISSVLSGCFSEEVEVPEIIPEKQIFIDKYERNAEITDKMTYKVDYMTSQNSMFNRMEIATMFNHLNVQVDDWECVTVGITTMGKIVEIIKTSNENYVTSNTNAIIAERQAIIDREYEEAVKKASEKGKTYDKPKKEVRTDDIHFDEPYAYTVTLGDNKKALPEEYKPTLLVDPDKYDMIYLDVTKYGIPYVRFEFYSTNNLYNTRITQESDWIMNGVKAADVTSHSVDEDGDKLTEIPEFVDADGLNRAAKQNIVMSGNIAFSGDGFTWDSLMLLCNALQLNWDEDEHGFEQSSDDNFTYYTITIHTNPFEYTSEYNPKDRLYVPSTRLVATFDPLTQVCINWTIDTYTRSTSFSNLAHDLSDAVEVNVHEYQVDTNDYPGMRESIKNWLSANALNTTTAYCATNTNNGKMFGVVDTGLTNLSIEPVIDGVTYHCLEYVESDDGSIYGKYIKLEELEFAETIEDESDMKKHIASESVSLNISCCLLDEDENIIATFHPSYTTIYTSDEVYYVADYEQTDAGYKNVRVLTEEFVNKLIMLYTKTYKLNEEQNAELLDLVQNKGIMAVRDRVNEMFAAAEEAQKEQLAQQGNKKLIAEAAEVNTKSDIAVLNFGEVQINFNNFTAKDITKRDFEPTGLYMHYSDMINIMGSTYKNAEQASVHASEQDGKINVFVAETDAVSFYNGVKVGMTADEANAAIADENITFVDGNLIMKNKSHTLVLVLNEAGDTVETIYLISNDYYKTMPRQNTTNEVDNDSQSDDANQDVEHEDVSTVDQTETESAEETQPQDNELPTDDTVME